MRVDHLLWGLYVRVTHEMTADVPMLCGSQNIMFVAQKLFISLFPWLIENQAVKDGVYIYSKQRRDNRSDHCGDMVCML